jgi:hypothetical protein
MMKKLFNNNEIKKIILYLTILTITIIMTFSTMFVLIGKYLDNVREDRLNSKLEEIIELKNDLNKSNQAFIEIKIEHEKQMFIADLKNDIRDILDDKIFFNPNIINENHLYFMEQQRIKYNIPKVIYYRLIFMESGFKMHDRHGNILKSSGNAMGYMQILPKTFNELCTKIMENENIYINDITDPYHNILAGTYYLSLRKNDIDRIFHSRNEIDKWGLTIAAYNAGIGDVIKAGGIPTQRYHNSNRFAFGDDNNETPKYVNFVLKEKIINLTSL